MDIKILRIINCERTRVENKKPILAHGVQFPSGTCLIDYRLDAVKEEQQLDNEHISIYHSISDVETGTSGNVEIVDTVRLDC